MSRAAELAAIEAFLAGKRGADVQIKAPERAPAEQRFACRLYNKYLDESRGMSDVSHYGGDKSYYGEMPTYDNPMPPPKSHLKDVQDILPGSLAKRLPGDMILCDDGKIRPCKENGTPYIDPSKPAGRVPSSFDIASRSWHLIDEFPEDAADSENIHGNIKLVSREVSNTDDIVKLLHSYDWAMDRVLDVLPA